MAQTGGKKDFKGGGMLSKLQVLILASLEYHDLVHGFGSRKNQSIHNECQLYEKNQ